MGSRHVFAQSDTTAALQASKLHNIIFIKIQRSANDYILARDQTASAATKPQEYLPFPSFLPSFPFPSTLPFPFPSLALPYTTPSHHSPFPFHPHLYYSLPLTSFASFSSSTFSLPSPTSPSPPPILYPIRSPCVCPYSDSSSSSLALALRSLPPQIAQQGNAQHTQIMSHQHVQQGHAHRPTPLPATREPFTALAIPAVEYSSTGVRYGNAHTCSLSSSYPFSHFN